VLDFQHLTIELARPFGRREKEAMRVRGFKAVRPADGKAEEVASVPYDTVNTVEARKLAEGKPDSFLHVIRAEIEFDDTTDSHSEEVYQRSEENFRKMQADGVLIQEAEPTLYVYRQVMGDHAQRGIVACSHVEDYVAGAIKKHEKTRKDKEDDRLKHVLTLNANAGPVFLAYRDDEAIDKAMAEVEASAPLYDITAPDGIKHTVWPIPADKEAVIMERFAAIPATYVADGHHRSAAASRAAVEKKKANPNHTGEEEYNWFMTVLFPASQLKVLPYNRALHDLNGLSSDEFMAKMRELFAVTEDASDAPDVRGKCSMYFDGKWYSLDLAGACESDDPVESLDVSILQDMVLGPVLGIDDPRTSTRIDFVGGIRGSGELVKLVDGGRAKVAFAVYPVGMDQVMAVSDADKIMAPKCTWFEPKLRSGLLVHLLD
jgi:uncharacterized protein (DUF1015 family)